MVETEPTVEADPSEAITEICRLCFKRDLCVRDIFSCDDELLVENIKSKTLLERLFDLFQITYVKSKLLPNSICEECYKTVTTFAAFREDVQMRESELQKLLQTHKDPIVATNQDERPGLNGNPGQFEPDNDCVIIDIDPEQEYEISDDDFSMESDTDIENTAVQPPTKTALQSNDGRKEAAPKDEKKTNTTDAQSKENSANAVATLKSNNFADISSADNAPKNTYLCQYCDMAFTVQTDCNEHESKHDPINPFVCSYCMFRTTNRQGLIYHIKELHDPERPYMCAICVKGFCRRSDLKKHTIVHTGVRPFTCPVCSKSFSRNTNLTKHMRIHSSIKPHVCQRCPRSFSTANEMMRHARSHMESKPFRCSRCSASFARKDKLHLHEQAHFRREPSFHLKQSQTAITIAGGSGGMDIVLPLTPYGEHENMSSFNAANTTITDDPYRHSILAAQLQQRPVVQKSTPPVKHQNSRVFICSICSKSFTRERDLQSHQALHLDSLFTCKLCGTGFSRREKLLRHEQEQHSPQYGCNICNMTFLKQDALDVHLKMHELQKTVAINAETAGKAAFGNAISNVANRMPNQIRTLPKVRPSAADMSFYSQMVPTMNLGFYSETKPDERNDI